MVAFNGLMPPSERVKCLLLPLAVIVPLDQWTKVLAERFLKGQQSVEFLGGFFRFQYAENPGAFLSLGSALPPEWRHLMFVIVTGAFILGAALYLLRGSSLTRLFCWALSLIVAGGIGNLIDRMLYGHVTDFMLVVVGPLRTGVFNIADMAILAGVLILLFESLEDFRQRRSQQASSKSA